MIQKTLPVLILLALACMLVVGLDKALYPAARAAVALACYLTATVIYLLRHSR